MGHVHRKIEGKSDSTWLVPIDTLNPASHIHVDTHDPKSEGYGGGMLEFELEDGTTYQVKGPWHSNSTAFFRDTGILISDLSMTRIILRENDHKGKIIYEEKEFVLGPFMRGERIAQQLANLINKPIHIDSYSYGGSSHHTARPGDMPHTMAVRGGVKYAGRELIYDDAEVWKNES